MTADQIHLLRKSFAMVEPQAQVAALVVYRRLFELDPSLRALFTSNIEEQAQKLMEMLGLAVSSLENAPALEKQLHQLGARHVGYRVRDEHYATVGQAMLDMLAEVLGERWTPPVREAWIQFYVFTSRAMQHGAAEFSARTNAKSVAEA